MQNGRKVQNSPTILFLSQLLYNVNLMTLGVKPSFFRYGSYFYHIIIKTKDNKEDNLDKRKGRHCC